MTATNSDGTSNTRGLIIETRRVYSSTDQIIDMPALDAIDTVHRYAAQWPFTPFSGQPTDLYRPSLGGTPRSERISTMNDEATPHFSFRILRRTANFGETEVQYRIAIVTLLHAAAALVGSGQPTDQGRQRARCRRSLVRTNHDCGRSS
jgi:hypothetical protein